MAEDVIETLDALQVTEPVVLGGLSMGGYVALALVAQYPERFRALMLMDTKAEADTMRPERLLSTSTVDGSRKLIRNRSGPKFGRVSGKSAEVMVAVPT